MAKFKRLLTKDSPLKNYWMLMALMAVVSIAFLFGDYIPLGVKNIFYTVSHVTKNILVFLLPFLVLPYVATSLSDLKENGALLIVLILLGVALSTFCGILYAYGIFNLFLESIRITPPKKILDEQSIQTLVNFNLPHVLSVELALLVGIVAGIALSYKKRKNKLHRSFKRYQYLADFFFSKLFTPILPLYIFGFLLKLSSEGGGLKLFIAFKNLLCVMLLAQVAYLFLYFAIGRFFNIKQALKALKNTFPAALTGFSTISSMVTLPVTLQVAYQNTKNNRIADLTIPTTVNCHAVGDAVALPLLTLAIYALYNGALPDFYTFIHFAGALTLAQFGAVAVSGGSVMIIQPLLLSQFNFSPEMIGLILALSMFLEPWLTACNVIGNSGYVLIVERFQHALGKLKRQRRQEKKATQLKKV